MSASDSSRQPREVPEQVRDDDGRTSAPAKRHPRGHEWTPARMEGFLRELRATLSVSQAAKSVGMSRQSAYKLRTRLAGTPFALAWQVALAGPRGAVSGRGVSPGRQAAFSNLAC